MNFKFAYPTILLLFVFLVFWVVYRLKQQPKGITHSMAGELAQLSDARTLIISRLPFLLRLGCLCLIIMAAARPQLYNVSREILSSGVDIILCLDTSGSMKAQDFKLNNEPVSRLTAVKKVVNNFISKRQMDRIGLVVFGEEAYTQSPLTMDKGLLLKLLDNMEIGMAGDKTAIGSAIAIGGKRLKDLKAKAKVLILVTDGRNNAGEITPSSASGAVQALGIKIYTIGVGGTGPAPFPVKTLFGERMVYQRVDLDEKTLKNIARIGGGQYFRAADSKQLSEIYKIIDQTEKTEVKVKEFFHLNELYYYFLVPAIIFFGLEILFKTIIFRVLP